MNVSLIARQGIKLVGDNTPALLTACGVAGTIGTAYLTAKATYKAADTIATHEAADDELSKKEKAKLVWREYIPPVVIGTLTITSIIAANHVSSRRIAALMAASGVTERAFQEYRDKVVEKLGSVKNNSIRDEVAKSRIENDPAAREIIISGPSKVLCCDMMTGRYFESSMEEIRKAANDVTADILHHMYASLSQFYEEVGLRPTSYSDTVGWNIDNRLELYITTVMSLDDRPCLAVDFVNPPVVGYERLYS